MLTGSEDESARKILYPRCIFTVKLRRRPGLYLWNIVFPSFLLALLSFLSFAHVQSEPLPNCMNSSGAAEYAGLAIGDRIDVPDRLSVTLTLLLTITALKFSAASALPQVTSVAFAVWRDYY